MRARYDHRPDSNRGRPAAALLQALLYSVLVHAIGGSLLFHQWQHASVQLPQPPLTVALQAPPLPETASVPTLVERHNVKPRSQPVQTLAIPHAPALEAAKVERVEAPGVVIPEPKSEPAPPAVASAPPAVSALSRSEPIEPPHFNAAYLNNPEPAYPPLAKRLGIEGRVVLRVQVSARGKPEQIAVAETSGASVLDDAALTAVRGWTFVPARVGDTPIAHAVDVPIRFVLKK